MNRFQRIKDILIGLFMILFAVALFLAPEDSYVIIATILGVMLTVYGFKMLWFYFTMARHMVGGKSVLFQAIVVLDLGLFTGSLAYMNSFIIIIYLLSIFAFAGFVDILRAVEAIRFKGSWKARLFMGATSVVFAITLLIIGIIHHNRNILVYGFCINLVYTGLVRIITSLRKTAIVYIQ